MLIVLAAVLVAAAVLKAAAVISQAVRPSPTEVIRTRAAALFATFAPALAAAEHDARALIVWEGLARTARRTFPDEFALLDQGSGNTFPFGRERLQTAHALWTAEWLSWERSHDAEYKLKAAVAEHDLAETQGSALGRAKLDAVEREKLDLYQRRYEDYIRVAKALQALAAA